MSDSAHKDHSDHSTDTTSEFRVGYIAGLGIVLCVTLVVSLYLVQSLFIQAAEEQLYKKNAAVENPALAELRLNETERLLGYKILDKSSGRYRIPIDQAMDLVIRDRQSGAAFSPAGGSANSPSEGEMTAPGGEGVPSGEVAPSGEVVPAAEGALPAAGAPVVTGASGNGEPPTVAPKQEAHSGEAGK